jgi:hypothetical protein
MSVAVPPNTACSRRLRPGLMQSVTRSPAIPPIPKSPGLCKTEKAPRDHAQPRVPEGRSSQIAPATPAGLSAPNRRAAELSRTRYF